MERPVLDDLSLWPWLAEDFQGFILRSGGKGEVAGIGQHLARFHDAVDRVLGRLLLFFAALRRQRDIHLRRRTSALAGVRLIDENGERAPTVLVANIVEDERETSGQS